MKKFQTLSRYALVGAAAVTTLFACKKDKNGNPNAEQNKYVNEWIYANMKEMYYWTSNIPASPDYKQDPSSFFSSLLKKPEDRYSWIQDNFKDLLASLSGVSKESGLEYDLFLVGNQPAYLAGIVEYVKKGSPAATAGLMRGDVFIEINGQPIAYTGKQSEVNSFVDKLGAPHSLGVSKVVKSSKGEDSLTKPVTINLPVVELAENPVYLDSVYTIEGQQIGYFMYNFFAPDKGDDSFAYDNQVDAVFGRFKAAGVKHLILDLRYNPGGDSRSTVNLGSNIVKGLDPSKEFFHRQFNPALQARLVAEYGEGYLVNKFTAEANNIGNNLTNLIILTSSGSASASELMINGLRPYMNVYLIGDTTEGKNLGSMTFYEENDPRNKWGMQPIVSRAFNSLNQSDYSDGFAPQEKYLETLHLGVLGDIREPMLNKALTKILGHAPARMAKSDAPGSRTIMRKVATSRSFKAYSGMLTERLPRK